ncbi:NnrU family protein [Aeromicrobium terrae]|uniref:Isoprenylcysteine carboxylmethyltransferase family protein n=1 Tax=Aeromicrobium terrae TaxID=2498846 RepID=A0A5C8NJ83_9ACTN|nr:isoprenylcysteine carboxylmethyltransferase family protein [Aeromicrobium terrae]TXL60851.1 isoprenylcysteine carboxylmethyltransferase family protein [Aeromicrobium terrae]
MRRLVDLALSALGWLGFNAVTLWTIAFLADEIVPRTVDGPHRVSTGKAVVIDLALLLLFAVQHSVMARPTVKTWMRRSVPPRIERTVYVLATNACLVLTLLFWEPFGGRVWHVDGAAAVAVWILCGAGWALAVASTFAVDHLELTGLRQAGWAEAREAGDLEVRGLHAIVRHPLMTGLLVAFWATPHLGASHLLFAAASTGYIVVGIHFEERDLRRHFGTAYDEYAARVPSVIPRPRRRLARV